MSEYIKHYRGVLTDTSCDVLIDALLNVDRKHIKEHRTDRKTFDQVFLNCANMDLIPGITKIVGNVIRQYKMDVPYYTQFFPKGLEIETPKVKGYSPGGQFKPHCDVDATSCPRYLAFLFYLNDNFTGGQTEFLPGIMVEPVKGSVVVFPPNWQHPHCGLPVETGNKYIMSTYLRYV